MKNRHLKKPKNPTLNGHISKTTTNVDSKLRLSVRSFHFLQDSDIFCALYPRWYMADCSINHNPWRQETFNKLQFFTFGHKQCLYLKRDSNTVLSCEICEIFKKSYFEEHLHTTATVRSLDLTIIALVEFFIQKVFLVSLDILFFPSFLPKNLFMPLSETSHQIF